MGPRCCASWLACRLSSLTSRHAPPQPPAPGGALRHGSTADRQRSQSGRAESALAIRAARARSRSFSRAQPFLCARGRLLPRARTSSKLLSPAFGHIRILDLLSATRAPGSLHHLPCASEGGREPGASARGEGVRAALCWAGGSAPSLVLESCRQRQRRRAEKRLANNCQRGRPASISGTMCGGLVRRQVHAHLP